MLKYSVCIKAALWILFELWRTKHTYRRPITVQSVREVIDFVPSVSCPETHIYPCFYYSAFITMCTFVHVHMCVCTCTAQACMLCKSLLVLARNFLLRIQQYTKENSFFCDEPVHQPLPTADQSPKYSW